MERNYEIDELNPRFGTVSVSANEKRWSAIGICLNSILAPTLRNVVDRELERWYFLLTLPPVSIDKQVYGTHKKTLPISTFPLQYKNINGNNVHESSSAYDYAVNDHLSLARLFVQPSMAKFTGFDDTMGLSALLSIMCEADPFVKCGAAAHARNVRSRVRNEWARSNFSNWTITMFNDAIRDIQCLVKSINLSAEVEEEVCYRLEHWRNKESHKAWKWENVSTAYKKKFKKLIEYGEKWPDKIMQVSGVCVCLNPEFLVGIGGLSNGVYVGLGTDGTEKAVKVFLKAKHGGLAGQEKELLRKCETKQLNHVVKYWFFDDTSHDAFAFLIMELCEETLENFVHHNSRDNLVKLAPEIIQQILKGLADLHSKPDRILHRDLKPLNILRNVHNKWLLADFGIGRILSDDDTSLLSKEKGTKNWRAVESCSEAGTSDDGLVRYKTKSDIQVAGMVAFYILTQGKHPFGEGEQILTNLSDASPVNLNMLDGHPLAKDLISWMLSHDSKDRPSAKEALQHPYLKSKGKQFSLLCGMGNEPHVKKNDANSDVVKELSKDKTDWRTRIDSDVLQYLSYDKLKKILFNYTSSWTDCLRLIRNIKEHWKDYPRTEPEATKVGDPQEFFLKIFPDLVLSVFKIARSSEDLKELSGLKEYFEEQ